MTEVKYLRSYITGKKDHFTKEERWSRTLKKSVKKRKREMKKKRGEEEERGGKREREEEEKDYVIRFWDSNFHNKKADKSGSWFTNRLCTLRCM